MENKHTRLFCSGDGKMLDSFISQFRIKLELEPYMLEDEYYLITPEMKNLNSENIVSIGLYLGCKWEKRFIPSLTLLEMISKKSKTITVNDKSAFLFTCGKKIINSEIIENKSAIIGDHIIIKDKNGSILGYGIYKKEEISNRFNIGNFLTRESL